MSFAEIMELNGAQVLRLPDEFRLSGTHLSIRRQGDAIILEPVKPTAWPAGFFERIVITDPAFERPPQGALPPAPQIG